jgi:hypothetical protein
MNGWLGKVMTGGKELSVEKFKLEKKKVSRKKSQTAQLVERADPGGLDSFNITIAAVVPGLFFPMKFAPTEKWPFLTMALAAQPTEFQHRAVAHGDESTVETLAELKQLLMFPITFAPYCVGDDEDNDLETRDLVCPAHDHHPFPKAGIVKPGSLANLLTSLAVKPEATEELASCLDKALSKLQQCADEGLATLRHLTQDICPPLPFNLPAPVGAGEVVLHCRLNIQGLTVLRFATVDGQRRECRHLMLSHFGLRKVAHAEVMHVLCTNAFPVTFLALPPSFDGHGPASKHIHHFQAQSLAIQRLHEKTSRISECDM